MSEQKYYEYCEHCHSYNNPDWVKSGHADRCYHCMSSMIRPTRLAYVVDLVSDILFYSIVLTEAAAIILLFTFGIFGMNMYCKLLLINFALWVIIISVVWHVWHFVAKFW